MLVKILDRPATAEETGPLPASVPADRARYIVLADTDGETITEHVNIELRQAPFDPTMGRRELLDAIAWHRSQAEAALAAYNVLAEDA